MSIPIIKPITKLIKILIIIKISKLKTPELESGSMFNIKLKISNNHTVSCIGPYIKKNRQPNPAYSLDEYVEKNPQE